MQQAHDRKLKTSDITAALHISPDTVTRRRKDAIDPANASPRRLSLNAWPSQR
ncbi:hypothetical protein Shyd_56340 [Streptomyces hydrogenans]|uniref:Uncharacterized protein n=1 Tax=Streptomyces hydrogenans TaxID=1873719 RepID=A0ABQ3PGW1_9ACTN|nr:hypothetical protein [Streptomyces hydrogenans]GHI24263.1 hypothetical protein Shyd_56340 [Streptomyces hydrogenans]